MHTCEHEHHRRLPDLKTRERHIMTPKEKCFRPSITECISHTSHGVPHLGATKAWAPAAQAAAIATHFIFALDWNVFERELTLLGTDEARMMVH